MFYNGTMNYLSKILIIASIFLGTMVTPFQISILSEPQLLSENTTPLTQVSFDISPAIAYAQDLGNAPDHDEGGSYFRCSWYNVPCHLLDFIYILAVPVGNFLVGLAGMVLDFFMLHSISSTSYRSGFIEAGWEILRDVTNIAFLFGLLYLAFNMVLGREHSKKSLINIILVALTINFSLFMSYAILDVSNVFAHVFYNKIVASEVTRGDEVVIDEFALGETVTTESRALAIADKIDPQKLTQVTESNDSMILKFIVVLVAGFINYTLVLTFLNIALLMIGRTVGLFVTIVLSPLAFASIIIPPLQSIPYIGFRSWIKDLVKLCFLAPVFLFFLYITVQFINIGLPGSEASEDVFTQLLNVLIPMIAIVVLIMLSKKVATDMAGKIGGIVATTVSKTLSTVGKVALGGLAIAATAGLAATGTAARVTGRATGSTRLRDAGRRLQSSRIDLTRLPGFERLAGRNMTNNIRNYTGSSMMQRLQAPENWWRRTAVVESTRADEERARTDAINAQNQRGEQRGRSDADWQRERDAAVARESMRRSLEQIQHTLQTGPGAGTTVDLGNLRRDEEQAYREMVDNPTAVAAEEKELNDLGEELKNLTQTLNAARANPNNQAAILAAERKLEEQKVRIDARKKGRTIDANEARNIIDAAAAQGQDVKDLIKSSTTNTYGTVGTAATSLRSTYDQKRKEAQEAEIKVIQDQITQLREQARNTKNKNQQDRLNNQATALARAQNSLLTDSERDDKKPDTK